jgi:hypothetical protein
MRSIGRNRKFGGVLVGALAFTAVAAFLLAGVGSYAVGSLSRANVEGDYASAVNVADAGLNAIIQKISQDPSDTTLVNHPDDPLTGSVPGVGTYSAYVVDDATGGTWVSPNDMRIISVGTVNGVSRKVSVRGARKSIFDEYAIFADNRLNLGGSGASSGSTQIIGNVGMNNGTFTPDATFNGSLNTDAINGEFTMNGGATSSDSGSNVVNSPDPVLLPTVSEMADALFGANGLTWLASNNNNAKILKLRSSDTALSAISGLTTMTAAQATLGDIACQFDSMGWTAATSMLEIPNGPSVLSSTNANDSNTATESNRRFANQIEGIYGLKTIFIPPGDYYFNRIDLKGGGIAVVMLTHLGRIRIWVDGPASGPADNLSVPVIFTDLTPSKFRLFYNRCNSINMAGNSIFAGGFYAYNPACTSGPTMNFSGNSTIYGSVIAGAIDITGGTQIIFPNDGAGSDPTDFALWFGIKNGWKELPINDGGPTFNTGTSN